MPRRNPEGPRLQEMEEKCREIGNIIGGVLDKYNNDHPNSPKVGFTLLMFDVGDKGWMTYISNANRDDMLIAMEEFIDKHIANG